IAGDISVTLIDADIEMIDIAGDLGAKVDFGDGTRRDLLRQAGAGEAELILFCLDGGLLTAAFLEAVHDAFPNAAIYVRAFDRRTVFQLRGAPIRYAVREVMESAVKMARLALEAVGVNLDEINRAEDMYRARDKERLK